MCHAPFTALGHAQLELISRWVVRVLAPVSGRGKLELELELELVSPVSPH